MMSSPMGTDVLLSCRLFIFKLATDGGDVYESGEVYSAEAEALSSTTRNAVPSRLNNQPPPLPPDAGRARLSAGDNRWEQ